ncbi:MAG: phosphatidate cytidylyltransferase [Lentisphaeria bacterium]|nr:phosphatidate cytidylyltransferase [Lentisphaeria bacterium]
MFKYRVIGFVLLMGLLGGIFFWRPWGEYLFLIAAPLMAALAVCECAKMFNDAGRKNFPGITAIVAYLLFIMAAAGSITLPAVAMAICIISLTGGVTMLCKNERLTERYFTSCGILFFLTPPLLGLLKSFYLPLAGAPAGAWLLFLCLATKATDSGGYIVGTLTARLPNGNHKIAPSLSPKKSWEGLFGGIALSLTVGWLFFKFAGYAPLWWYLGTAFMLSLGSFFGDLAESAVKRMCNIKDSGHWVPGMGGAFDVLDSFIFNGILFYVPVMILQMNECTML